MTGLNLEAFLHLLRADFGAWATLGLIAVVLALMAWTSWGSRRALRKCLVLSVLAHCGLALYGGTIPVVLLSLRRDDGSSRERIRSIKVDPVVETHRITPEPGPAGQRPNPSSIVGRGSPVAPWDRPASGLALLDFKLTGMKPDLARDALVRRSTPEALAADSTTPEAAAPAPASPETRAARSADTAPPPPTVTPGSADDIAAPRVARAESMAPAAGPSGTRIRPGRSGPGSNGPAGSVTTGRPALAPLVAPETPALLDPGSQERPATPAASTPATATATTTATTEAAPTAGDDAVGEVVKNTAGPVASTTTPDTDIRRRLRPAPVAAGPATPGSGTVERPRLDPSGPDPLALARVTPSGLATTTETPGTGGRRPLLDVPEVYRTRLDPNRSALAFRAGASPASEQAVERALDWLARHQNSDGRWDAGIARYEDGTAVNGDDDFTVHCPPGETCFGECIYFDADTAVTGLALLAYLGAGYTHADGKYVETVGKGLDFLLASQKPDGDLRGPSRAVGMYCHAMATIALCEAYALTGDARLRRPVERAIGFIARARATDGLAWRYAPGEPVGDTSILGWVVMALKSAREVGIEVPTTLQTGTLRWLDRVASGNARGLARYQPGKEVTPTMTAEAWVCRQFLGVGGPGPASSEAAAFLLAHGPKTDPYNLYYWYYGTLAMYQNGGEAWSRWNAEVRDAILTRQRNSGHATGSWDPDPSAYGSKGGRIYCTALATLSLEVYYRYLRLYDDPKLPPTIIAPARPRTLGRRDESNRVPPLQPAVSPPR